MTASTIILRVLYVSQHLYAAYNLYLSQIAIQKLRMYEETSEKAAKWSNEAERQLHKTRTTQASLATSLLISFLSSAYLTFNASTSSMTIKVGVAAVNILFLDTSSQYVGAFWANKKRIPLPGTGDYNDAMRITQRVRKNMVVSEIWWVVLGGVGGLISFLQRGS